MRVHAGGRSTNTLTAARGPFVAAVANHPGYLVEVGVFNTTDTEVAIMLRRLSAVGTGGTALDEASADHEDYTPLFTAVNTPTADHTVVAGEYARATLGAAKGAGVIWTFGKNGIVIPTGTGAGYAILLATGTAQVVDFYFIWDE